MNWYHQEKVDAKICPIEGEYLKTRYYLSEEDPIKITVGVGETSKWSVLRCKEVYAKGVSTASELEVKSCVFDLTEAAKLGSSGIFAAVEGIYGASYQQKFSLENQSKPEQEWYVWVNSDLADMGQEEMELAVKEGEELAKSVIEVRNLVNLPGNHLVPETFAARLVSMMEGLPVEAEVYDEKQLRELGLHALLSVGDSSGNSARMAVLRYTGATESSERLGYVGKGVTCDSGGYCVKTAASMAGIKGDMAGGAAVAAAVRALAVNHVRVNVTAVVPICENRISRESSLPGDVITGLSGKTIEILNTDAEGRLILSDAITWAIQKEGATKLVDIATLTGAVVTMLGFVTTGVMCSDDDWWNSLKAASEVSGEKYWRMPMDEEYERLIDSEYADVRNTSKDGCGSVTAGLFLHRFAEDLPWMHLDIAGTASVNSPIWKFQTAGATGAGTTTLYHLAVLEAGKNGTEK